jgi:hypothetical protein
MSTNGDKLRDACELAAQTFRKLNHPDFHEIISKLEFCIGSYNFDKNPSGLAEYGHHALVMLKEVKKKNPRKINRNVLAELEESLTR